MWKDDYLSWKIGKKSCIEKQCCKLLSNLLLPLFEHHKFFGKITSKAWLSRKLQTVEKKRAFGLGRHDRYF